MRKRTRFTQDDIINCAPKGSNTTPKPDYGTGGWGSSSNTSSSNSVTTSTNSDKGWNGFGQQNTNTGLGSWDGVNNPHPRKRGPREPVDLPLATIGKVLLVLIGVVVAIGLVKMIVQALPLIAQGLSNLCSLLATTFVIALIIFILLNALLGRFLPPKFKLPAFAIIWILCFLGNVTPEVATAVGTIVIMVVGIIILIYGVIK